MAPGADEAARTEPRRAERLRLLARVTRLLSSSLERDDVLRAIAGTAGLLMGVPQVSVWILDEAAGLLEVRAFSDPAVAADFPRRQVRIGEGFVGLIAERRQPVTVDDIFASDRLLSRDWARRHGLCSYHGMPILYRGAVLGVLGLMGREPFRLDAEGRSLLDIFVGQAGLAIRNADLHAAEAAARSAADSAARAKRAFLANMSHELRTPMNAILGYSEMIRDGLYGPVPPAVTEALQRIDQSGRHLVALIGEILDLAAIEAGQLALSVRDYALADVIDTVCAAAEPLAADKGVALSAHIPAALPVGRGDERRLTQVVMALVANAIKFTDTGAVTVDVASTRDSFLVSVSDTGPGIAPEQQTRIFEEFYQADASSTRTAGGTGLGLAIARTFVEMHRGRIWVESTPGRGSTFRFTIPIRLERRHRSVPVAVERRRRPDGGADPGAPA